VTYGIHDDVLAIAGASVLVVKGALRDVFNIPYFVHAVVNGTAVPVAYILRKGDHLTFARLFGVKGGAEDERTDEVVVERLLALYPELQEMKQRVLRCGLDTEASLDMLHGQFAKWMAQRFGPWEEEIRLIIMQLVQRVQRMPSQGEGRPRGRKPTTRLEADFTNRYRPGMPWAKITELWNREHQEKARTLEQMRGAYRRFYGDKAKNNHCRRNKTGPSLNPFEPR